MSSTTTSPPIKTLNAPTFLKFVFGGISGMSACFFTQPLDLVKNRMQVSGEMGSTKDHRNSWQAIKSIYRNERLTGFYNGLSAGLLRQGSYTSMRLGLYSAMFEHFSSASSAPSLWAKMSMGFVAGGISSLACTPADVGLIRMTIDGRLPIDKRRGYKNVLDALIRVSKEESVLTLWRGCSPTVVRAMVVNAAQLATYSEAKQKLLSTGYIGDNFTCYLLASIFSGFVCTITSMPVDMAKTRMQNMKVVDGVAEYRSSVDVLMKVIRHEGVFSLWKGFTPCFLRLGPHTVLVLLFLEQINKLYFRCRGVKGKAAI